MFSLRRKSDPERNLHALLDQALTRIDPSRFDTSIDGAITCRPMAQALNRLAGSSDRFAPVSLEALTFALAKLPQRTIAETLADEYATDPVVTAVMAGALGTSNAKTPTPKSTKRFDDWWLA